MNEFENGKVIIFVDVHLLLLSLLGLKPDDMWRNVLDIPSTVVYPFSEVPLRQGNGGRPSAGPLCLFPKAMRLSNRVLAMIKISSDIPGRIKITFSYIAVQIGQSFCRIALILLAFQIYTRLFRNQVHRGGAENAEGMFL